MKKKKKKENQTEILVQRENSKHSNQIFFVKKIIKNKNSTVGQMNVDVSGI